jgi:hypothetical protein
MIFLALKIVRFLFRLVFKILLLPVKLAKLAMGGGSDDEYDYGDEPLSEENSGSSSLGGSTSIADGSPLDVDAETAARNIVWFRWGLFGIGALQVVVSLLLLVELASVPAGSQILLVLGSVAFAAALPVLAAVLLPRRPTAGWYLGMGLVALQTLGSVFSLPQGLVWILVGAPLAYLGYTGRPALGVVFGDESTGPSTDFGTDSTTGTVEPTGSVAATEPTGRDDPDTAGRTAPTESAETPYAASIGDGAADGERGSDGDAAASTEAGAGEAGADSELVFGGESETDGDTDAGDGPNSEPDSEPDSEPEPDPSSTDGSDGVVDTYRDGLTADDPVVRADAVRDLAAAVEPEPAPSQAAVDAIADRLEDDDADVRSTACEALGNLGASRAESRLRDRRIDPDPEVSRAASRALRNIE